MQHGRSRSLVILRAHVKLEEMSECGKSFDVSSEVSESNLTHLCYFQNLNIESGKVWPNIPPPVPVPMCNGCGVVGTPEGPLGAHLNKPTQKYGQ